MVLLAPAQRSYREAPGLPKAHETDGNSNWLSASVLTRASPRVLRKTRTQLMQASRPADRVLGFGRLDRVSFPSCWSTGSLSPSFAFSFPLAMATTRKRETTTTIEEEWMEVQGRVETQLNETQGDDRPQQGKVVLMWGEKERERATERRSSIMLPGLRRPLWFTAKSAGAAVMAQRKQRGALSPGDGQMSCHCWAKPAKTTVIHLQWDYSLSTIWSRWIADIVWRGTKPRTASTGGGLIVAIASQINHSLVSLVRDQADPRLVRHLLYLVGNS